MMRARKVYEKFEEKSDPISDLGIGVYKIHKNFSNYDDLIDYIITYLPIFLKTKKIPDDIIFPEGYTNLFRWKYYNYLDDYIYTYFTVLGGNTFVQSHGARNNVGSCR